MVGRIRDSGTFEAGQRSEIGRYEVPRVVSFPGFCIGMTNDNLSVLSSVTPTISEMRSVPISTQSTLLLVIYLLPCSGLHLSISTIDNA